jgi:polysaccharide biosynthesis protein PelD
MNALNAFSSINAELSQAKATPDNATLFSDNRTIGGVRVLAILEITALIAVALLIDHFAGRNDRFTSMSLHPFWIPIILAASYYGTREGLMAVVLSTLALLAGNFPEQKIDEMNNAWLLRTLHLPLLWGISVLPVGLIADAMRNRLARFQARNTMVESKFTALAQAYERLQLTNQNLEARVAGQLCTVNAMYQASRAIDRLEIGEVLMGVNGLVRQVMNPIKFSLFLLNGARLEAVSNEGWASNEPYSSEIESGSPLYESIVYHRRLLVMSNPTDSPILGREGLIAGPLVNNETGELVGMLKIEIIEFRDLNWSSIQNFRIICDWIGASLANAQRVEDLVESGLVSNAMKQSGY